MSNFFMLNISIQKELINLILLEDIIIQDMEFYKLIS